jgi:hypothetical protein
MDNNNTPHASNSNKWTVVRFEGNTKRDARECEIRPQAGVVSDTVQVKAMGRGKGYMTSWKVTSKRQTEAVSHIENLGTVTEASTLLIVAQEQFRIALELSQNPSSHTTLITQRPVRTQISIRDLLHD